MKPTALIAAFILMQISLGVAADSEDPVLAEAVLRAKQRTGWRAYAHLPELRAGQVNRYRLRLVNESGEDVHLEKAIPEFGNIKASLKSQRLKDGDATAIDLSVDVRSDENQVMEKQELRLETRGGSETIRVELVGHVAGLAAFALGDATFVAPVLDQTAKSQPQVFEVPVVVTPPVKVDDLVLAGISDTPDLNWKLVEAPEGIVARGSCDLLDVPPDGLAGELSLRIHGSERPPSRIQFRLINPASAEVVPRIAYFSPSKDAGTFTSSALLHLRKLPGAGTEQPNPQVEATLPASQDTKVTVQVTKLTSDVYRLTATLKISPGRAQQNSRIDREGVLQWTVVHAGETTRASSRVRFGQ